MYNMYIIKDIMLTYIFIFRLSVYYIVPWSISTHFNLIQK